MKIDDKCFTDLFMSCRSKVQIFFSFDASNAYISMHFHLEHIKLALSPFYSATLSYFHTLAVPCPDRWITHHCLRCATRGSTEGK